MMLSSNFCIQFNARPDCNWLYGHQNDIEILENAFFIRYCLDTTVYVVVAQGCPAIR